MKKTRPRKKSGKANCRSAQRKKLYQAVSKASKNRNPCVRISRTVEQIDQTGDDWREKTSKLMFIVGLGLQPKNMNSWKGLPQLTVRVPVADPAEVAKVQERYRLERLERIKKLREKYRSKALANDADKSLRSSSGSSYSPKVIDVIDLVSDDETSCCECNVSKRNSLSNLTLKITKKFRYHNANSSRNEKQIRTESRFEQLHYKTSITLLPRDMPEECMVFLESDEENVDRSFVLPSYPNIHVSKIQ